MPRLRPLDDATCARCGEELFAAWLAIPPGIEVGAILTPSVLLPGMRPVAFCVASSL